MAYCCIEHHLNEAGALWCTACDSLVEGAVIGDYRLVSHIGNGSTADVYLAEQSLLNRRRVVIKILHRSWSEAHVSRFEREAAALASLSHPYILPIFSYGVLYKRPAGQAEQARQVNVLPYLVLPYAVQGSLAQIFEREGKCPWSLARMVTIAKEVAEALDYAHAHGVIHRDVKPANILQMGSHALLCDFSVASPIDAEVSHLNAPWAGSPAYMAPEVWQLRPGRYSDQYALAVSCFFLLTGQLPLSRSRDTETRSWSNMHCFVAPRSIRELRPDLPLAIDAVLLRALSKDPHDRYKTVGAFASDLFAASQDITQEIGSFPEGQRSRNIKARPDLISSQRGFGVPREVVKVEDRNVQPPLPFVALPSLPVTAPVSPDSPVTPVTPVADLKGFSINDVQTEALAAVKRADRWVWYALLLNLLVCLTLAAEYGWQAQDLTATANMLLAAWPALLIGPLLARVFRRVPFTTLSWGLFWGAFFGLTDALLSMLVCLVWTLLADLHVYYHPGDGFSAVIQEAVLLTQQAVLPLVLGLWIAVIGGAIIGILHIHNLDV